MKPLIQRSVNKIAIAIMLCVLIATILNCLAPLVSNDLALNQLENDDMGWAAMDLWYKIQNYVSYAYGLIALICVGSIGKDCYRFMKMKREGLE